MTYEIKYRNEDEMIDSGVEWLEKVPGDWNVSKVKYNINYIQTGSTPTTKRPDYYEGNINWFNPVDLNQEILEESKKEISKQAILDNEAKLFSGDSVLIVGIGATAGKTSYLINKSSFNQQITGIHSKENNNKYIFYQFKSISNELLKLANFTTLPILNNEFLKNIGLGFPVLKDQNKITNFLDLKTAEFDSIISKKEDLIEKLEEVKKSLISEVVTGKVKIVDGELVERKAAEMKDSGVEWLGMIPKDWEIKKLKYLSENYPSNVDKKSYPGEKQVKLCNYIDVYYNDYITEDLEFMKASASRSEINRFTLKKGNILLTKDSESPNDIAIPSYVKENIDNLICGYHLMIVKPFTKYISKYIYYQFLTTGIKNYFETVSNGVTRYGIGIGGFNNLALTLPKIEEQEAIVKSLDIFNRKINSIITKTKLQIQKLKQAKQSLISEAVTGKIDLRDWEIQEI